MRAPRSTLRAPPPLLATLLILLLAAAPIPDRAHDSDGSSACPEGAERLIEHRLFFGRNRGDEEVVSEAEWQAFLAEEITPRFQAGLTVIDAAGQWRDGSGRIIRERSKLVIVLTGADANTMAPTMEIVRAYKRAFGQESVLRTVATVCAAF